MNLELLRTGKKEQCKAGMDDIDSKTFGNYKIKNVILKLGQY